MNPFSEDNLVEQTVIKLIKGIWADSACHINAFKDEDDLKLGRDNQGEVVLKKYLLPALQKLNPTLSADALAQAVDAITRDRSNLSLVKANQEVYKLLLGGVNVQVAQANGEMGDERVRFFDFDTPTENHFLCVSQLWVVGEMYTRRADVVLFVNGIPLVLLELKASHKSLVDAHRDNIRDYKVAIPKLFWYNLGILISNGIENKFGSLTAPYEFFNEWKKADSEEDKPKTDVATILRGVCDKIRLLDIFENFILFDESKGDTKKIVPRYFQYLGVNRAFQNVTERKELEGRLGVFWHTQGSGKSYSMVWLSQKALRKLTGNFTFVIVTDRTQLDGQAYDNFANVGVIHETEVHADSISHLKELLAQDHRQIFTTIQKFQDIQSSISEREDIIVMTDEAHRTQYDRMALNMRKSLPRASFIGFTGTPLMIDGEAETVKTFGKYVSVYNFGQSVADGATVPLYYDNRVPRLKNVNENLEEQLGQLMDKYELDEDEEEKLQREYSSFYEIITREDRLDTIARDIVEHYVGRGYDGKAMVVCIDKPTTFRMYDKVKKEWDRYIAKLRMDLSRITDEREHEKILAKLEQHENVDMAVMVSLGGNQNEIADMEAFEIDIRPIRERIVHGNLEEEFKKADSNLRIIFVCAMWMTGFDVPNLSTLYLDKPLKNHTLMQTIARANRVADEGKKNGLIVDYIGVFKNIERALALYAANGVDEDDIIKSKDELLTDLKNTLRTVKEFMRVERVELPPLIEAPSEQKLLLLEKYANTIIGQQEKKKKFLNLASDLQSVFRSVLPDPDAEEYYKEVTAVRVLASRIRDVGAQSVDVSQVKKDLEDLLDKSIQAGEYVISSRKKIKDLSALDVDALHAFFAGLDNKNLQIEELSAELEQKIAEMVQRNKKRAKFMERLLSLLQEYNSGAHDVDQIFDDLVALAKDLSVEEQRAVKENLSEEELAIFDLLVKENLNPDEVAHIKGATHELLTNLKPLLVPHWRDFETNRAGVKIAISELLYAKLPEPTYTEKECELKGLEVYNFVYEHYQDARVL
ncbi:MAG: DEAD/DEAH box helicase [Candidatus Taylorbacteria bacterium CG11_big_fil_rev_8_21_14_0_20_46_11]|uniref:Type I restriction enzyme endonuclease subunit n=1 Tax=Candidatus Taylorbacteria bacterium CG11_big_fil_rev_8_21_14_0_20_46_11 TaxID=1975025 RepID=A0A2H0KCL5_9BACT|nr:MAG: DEAD/DEAH box helicase [Candidatus Taylorbacteria bacterium CG11_big_fil_rev_8_21_14_0_20_46_11]